MGDSKAGLTLPNDSDWFSLPFRRSGGVSRGVSRAERELRALLPTVAQGCNSPLARSK